MTPREWLREVADVMAAVGYIEESYSLLCGAHYCPSTAAKKVSQANRILGDMLARGAAREQRQRRSIDAHQEVMGIVGKAIDAPCFCVRCVAVIK
ncbi:MAG TPA: hypothetical protein VFG83_16800 [Kofleriaceae bacterium]|nr:hypothetical protein [Kofleriaceae bacterium]